MAKQGERLDAEGVRVEEGTEVRGKVDIRIARDRPLTDAEQEQIGGGRNCGRVNCPTHPPPPGLQEDAAGIPPNGATGAAYFVCGPLGDPPLGPLRPGVIQFMTGATRSAENLYDPYGFLNPRVVQTYCEYMERHRVQKDGKTRDSDNWQRGMPSSRAYRSLLRHTFDVWLMSWGYRPKSADCADITDALCAVVFNAMLLLKNWGDENHHEEGK